MSRLRGASVSAAQEKQALADGRAAYVAGWSTSAAPAGPLLIRSAWLIGWENGRRAFATISPSPHGREGSKP